MALTKHQKALRRDLIGAIAAAHPGRPFIEAVEEGAAQFRDILAEARSGQPPARSPGELAALSADEFEQEFSGRLAEVGSTAGLSSPYWQGFRSGTP